MKLMCPAKRLAKLAFPIFLIALLFSISVSAQRSKKAAPVKKSGREAKDARKDSRKDNKKEQLAKKNRKEDSRKEKASAKSRDSRKDTKKEKLTAKERSKEKASDKDNSRGSRAKRLAEARRIEAERRAAEEARRQAILAERRRREELARQARERRLAFERGLRNETAENILHDVTDGEDLNVRRAAVGALGNRAGTVVVMEAQTGKIVTIVNQDWAIRNSFKPCSTIKLVTGVAGLNEHVINEDGQIGNGGGMELQDAIAHSNNGYFQRVGSNLGSRKMVEYAHELGLGERTGINADGETAGRVPNGNNNPRIYSHGDDFEVTPLQLAVLSSALANGGKKVVPQISQQRYERSNFRPLIKDRIELPASSIEGMLPGMVGAAEYGTAHRGVDYRMGVAGKTGSCIFKGTWIGLFTSIAPVEDPKYSVVVITRGEGERGKYAAAVAGKVYQALGSQLHRNPDRDLARRNLKPQPASSRMAARDEDDDDADSPENTQAEETPIVVGQRNAVVAAQPTPAPKKLIQKTTQSKPVSFAPVVITFDKDADRKAAAKERPRIVKNK
ncbi:MAG TPA: penicillin-binding transpeptidase domain-containing protein [Pyrinomonadaceae bacterium]|nr:penicillin-binding transpeptidase domain-containing protein [Pyrinomonadaceae bacterium]